MRAHGRRTYSFAQHGNTEMGSNLGKHLIRDNRADVWTPCYGDGITVIRILPQHGPEPGTWEPYRKSAEHNDFGDWIRRYPAVRAMGDPPVTFITNEPDNAAIPDPRMTPGWILFNAIDSAVQRGQDRPGWAALLRGGRNRGAQLPRPSEVYLVQCAVMHHKTRTYSPPKPFDNPQARPIVMELGPSAGLAMLAELNRTREGYVGGSGNWEDVMALSDPVAINLGQFVTFYKLSDGDPRQQRNPQQAGWNAAPTAWQQPQGRQQEQIGFGCYLESTFGQFPANMEQVQERIRTLVAPWDNILEFPTIEQQAHLLADKFPADVIEYAFADYPEWIPEHVRRRARAAVTAPGAAIPPGPGGPVQGAGPMGTQMPMAAPPMAAGGWGALPTAMPPQAMPPAAPPPVGAPTAPAAPQAMPPLSAAFGPMAVPPSAAAPPVSGGWGAMGAPTAPSAPSGPMAPQVAPQAPPAAVAPPATIPASMAWMGQANPVAAPPAAIPAAAPPAAIPAAAPPVQAPVAPQAPLPPSAPAPQDGLAPGAPSGQPQSRAAAALAMAQQMAGRG